VYLRGALEELFCFKLGCMPVLKVVVSELEFMVVPLDAQGVCLLV
jgi:hypothetical protein